MITRLKLFVGRQSKIGDLDVSISEGGGQICASTQPIFYAVSTQFFDVLTAPVFQEKNS